MRWLVIDEQTNQVIQHNNLDAAVEYAKDKINAKYAKQKAQYLYTVSSDSKTLYIVAEDHMDKYKVKTQNDITYMSLSKSQILDKIKEIELEHGPKYFITPGSRTSQQFTGKIDYWQFVYELTFVNTSYEPCMEPSLTKKYELEKLMDSVGLQNIILITVSVEHIVSGDIMHNDTVLLGEVKCNKYHQYKHKL